MQKLLYNKILRESNMQKKICKLSILVAAIFLCAICKSTEKNIAFGKKVTASPKPNYQHCKDKNLQQLTDGKYVKGKQAWVEKGTVGWRSAMGRNINITVDLGKIYPIEGFSFNCAAGGNREITWPHMISIMVSDDGKNYYLVDDLVRLNKKKPPVRKYAVFKYISKEMKTHGRYVKFMVPLSRNFLFTDEIEVFLGKKSYKDISRGKVFKSYDEAAFCSYVARRFNRDVTEIKRAIEKSRINNKTKISLMKKVRSLKSEILDAADKVDQKNFKAIFPYNSWHKQLIAIRAAVWRAMGVKQLVINNANRWDMQRFWAEPALTKKIKPVSIKLMRNEIRSGVINISNPLSQTTKISLSTTGDIPKKLLNFSQVEWTDTQKGIPTASALIPLKGDNTLNIIPGMTRQLWIEANTKNIRAGKYEGDIVLNAGSCGTVNVPIKIEVFPLEFPETTSLLVGGWDYTHRIPSRGITKGNVKQVLKHLQERYVNVTWGAYAVLDNGVAKFDASGKMTTPPGTKMFDGWIKRWPNARLYAVYVYGFKKFNGIKMGTPAFNNAISNWLNWWKSYIVKKGIKPEQIVLLVVDEPHSKSKDERILAWAKAVKAAKTGFVIWEDPVWSTPEKHADGMLDICDILCLDRYIYWKHKTYRDFYNKRNKQKQKYWFYSCKASRLKDPYAYYLLQAWECLRYGAKGSSYWAFCGNRGNYSSWNPYQKGTDYAPYFLDSSSVTPAKPMEALAESVRDYEYFMMLKKAIKDAKKKGGKQEEIAKAQKLLISAPNRVLNAPNTANSTWDFMWETDKDRTIADKERIKALVLLKKLSE